MRRDLGGSIFAMLVDQQPVGQMDARPRRAHARIFGAKRVQLRVFGDHIHEEPVTLVRGIPPHFLAQKAGGNR